MFAWRVQALKYERASRINFGVASFYFRLSVMDVRETHAEAKIDIPCFKNMGERVFQMTVESAAKLSHAEIDDALEPWLGVALYAGAVLKVCDARPGEIDIIPHDMRKLTDDFLE